jgi:predicted component of viral defense system (DUF524 family)
MSVKTTTKSTSLLALVRKFSAVFNLGNEGKVESFYYRVIKQLKKEVITHNKNLDTIKFNHEQQLESLNDKLEDANEALSESYLNIDVDRITTNEAQTSYIEVYLDRIDIKVATVRSIESEIENENKYYYDATNRITKQIESLNKRIDIISAQ